MPLKVSIIVKVEDGNYNVPVEISQARTVQVAEGSYKDPQPKGFPQARATFSTLMREVAEATDNAILEAGEHDTARVDRERAAEAKV